jgi:hypothetical protein
MYVRTQARQALVAAQKEAIMTDAIRPYNAVLSSAWRVGHAVACVIALAGAGWAGNEALRGSRFLLGATLLAAFGIIVPCLRTVWNPNAPVPEPLAGRFWLGGRIVTGAFIVIALGGLLFAIADAGVHSLLRTGSLSLAVVLVAFQTRLVVRRRTGQSQPVGDER